MKIISVELGSLVSRWYELTEGHFEHTLPYLPGTADKDKRQKSKDEINF